MATLNVFSNFAIATLNVLTLSSDSVELQTAFFDANQKHVVYEHLRLYIRTSQR